MRQHKVISLNGYSVTITEATALQGMRHSLLRENTAIANTDDEATRIFKRFFYPAMVASVTDHSGFEVWPPSFDQVADLPDKFAVEWMDAAWELNPHWKPQGEPTPQELEEKKESTTG